MLGVTPDDAAQRAGTSLRTATGNKVGHGIDWRDAVQEHAAPTTLFDQGTALRRFVARVAVEHSLARISNTQGARARDLGTRKNLHDLRCHAAIANLYVAMGRAA